VLRAGLDAALEGSQLIRTAAILQLLLGNIGGPAAACSRFAATRRSRAPPTSHAVRPAARLPDDAALQGGPDDLAAYVEKRGAKTGQWAYLDRYLVSLLKAYYGEAAQKGNDYGLRWLPR
jgi:formate dehydrogenase major subunit